MNLKPNDQRKLGLSLSLATLLAAMLACGLPAQPPSIPTLNAATNLPAPTLAPPKSPTATATQPLVPLGTAAATGSAAPTAAATAGADCDNVFLPTTAGSTWTYTSVTAAGTGGRTVTTTKVGKDSFFHDTQLVHPPLRYEVSWQCTAQGLVEYGGGVLASLNAASKVKIDILSNVGVSLPSSITIGDTWSQTTDFHMSSDSLNGTGHWIGHFTAVGPEKVTVPAGTFDTMRIDGTLQSISDPYPALNATYVGSSWYAPLVGLVKATGQTSDGSPASAYELDLVSYKIP